LSLEKLGKTLLKKQIITLLDKTHSLTLAEILNGLPDETKSLINEKILIDTLVEMLKEGKLAVIHLKG